MFSQYSSPLSRAAAGSAAVSRVELIQHLRNLNCNHAILYSNADKTHGKFSDTCAGLHRSHMALVTASFDHSAIDVRVTQPGQPRPTAHVEGRRGQVRDDRHPVAAAPGLPVDLGEGALVGAGVAVLRLRDGRNAWSASITTHHSAEALNRMRLSRCSTTPSRGRSPAVDLQSHLQSCASRDEGRLEGRVGRCRRLSAAQLEPPVRGIRAFWQAASCPSHAIRSSVMLCIRGPRWAAVWRRICGFFNMRSGRTACRPGSRRMTRHLRGPACRRRTPA